MSIEFTSKMISSRGSAPKAPVLSVHEGDLARADKILSTASLCDPQANVALLGDKRFLFSASGNSFLSYGVKGQVWIAMGGPVGKSDEAEELVRSFLSYAKAHKAKASFYGLSPQFHQLAERFNLTCLKTGERALLDLTTFSLDGKTRQVIRTHRNRHIKQGYVFSVEGPGSVRRNLQVLRKISDEWLGYQTGGEKGFGLGRFDFHYVDRLPQAFVRDAQGKIVAFASLWPTADKSRIGVDLMRYGEDGPNGVMDYLFAEMFLWAKSEGYRHFDLNTSPAAGVSFSKSAPILTTLATLAYEHGEKIYNFKGVRRFKSKFHPEWEDVFMAVPKGSSALRAGLVAAALINKPK